MHNLLFMNKITGFFQKSQRTFGEAWIKRHHLIADGQTVKLALGPVFSTGGEVFHNRPTLISAIGDGQGGSWVVLAKSPEWVRHSHGKSRLKRDGCQVVFSGQAIAGRADFGPTG